MADAHRPDEERCPECESQDVRLRWEEQPPGSDHAIPVERCVACGFGWIHGFAGPLMDLAARPTADAERVREAYRLCADQLDDVLPLMNAGTAYNKCASLVRLWTEAAGPPEPAAPAPDPLERLDTAEGVIAILRRVGSLTPALERYVHAHYVNHALDEAQRTVRPQVEAERASEYAAPAPETVGQLTKGE